jgi:hypothetical protein
MFQNGIDEQLIMSNTGHRSIEYWKKAISELCNKWTNPGNLKMSPWIVKIILERCHH